MSIRIVINLIVIAKCHMWNRSDVLQFVNIKPLFSFSNAKQTEILLYQRVHVVLHYFEVMLLNGFMTFTVLPSKKKKL